jgi:hypothetical protein
MGVVILIRVVEQESYDRKSKRELNHNDIIIAHRPRSASEGSSRLLSKTPIDGTPPSQTHRLPAGV